MLVGIVHTAAGAELVVRDYKLYTAQQTQPGTPHQEAVSIYHVHQRRKRFQEGENRLQGICYD